VVVEGTIVVVDRDRRCHSGVDGVDVQGIVENTAKAMLGKRRSGIAFAVFSKRDDPNG
jgi:hypothetical protein